ncbi:MAG: metallophosphoesterase [Candidatus Latescibacteria bacterium]|nr:metallophosphoesterase [bacterium]MBD3423216.1 metallophosphoesterase [Candidatus Latescibacterota bacterium]
MRICHISDTHISLGSEFQRKTFESTIKQINSEDFDLVIHSGDITTSGILEEYKEARRLTEKIRHPLVVIPGNHDARNGGISIFSEVIGNPSGVIEMKDAVITYVDSSIPDSNQGRVGMINFRILQDALGKHQDKDIKIVLIHHHVVPVPMAGRERNVLSNAGDILNLLLRYNVDLVLSGHRHYPNVHQVERTLFINAGTLSSSKTRYGDVNSYGVIEIEGDRFRLTTRRVNGESKVQQFFMAKPRVFKELGKRKFRIAHLSNTFISDKPVFLRNHFNNAVRSMNRYKPDLVAHCGGIVYEGIPHDYHLAGEMIDLIESPKIFAPAGRDINYLGYYLFNNYFGKVDQEISNGEILVKSILSAQYDSKNGIVGPRERENLVREIRKSEEGFKCLMLHHNIIPIPHSREKGLLEDSGDFLRDVVDSKVDLVLTGTSSHPFSVKVGETLVVNANSLSSIYQRSINGNSYNLIDIFEKAIMVSEVNSLWGRRKLIGLWWLNGFSG